MESMIQQILDMDKKSQEMIVAAQQEKLNAEQDIAASTARLREEYLRQTQNRIRINAENDRTIMEQKWRRKQKKYQEQAARMQEMYEQNGQAWVDAIVARVRENA